MLDEETVPRPDTLYGEVKLAAEKRLAAMASPGFPVASLRVTGVFGPAGAGRTHKWSQLFADYLDGRAVEPRCGTEVHGGDVAQAVELMLRNPAPGRPHTFNVSDLLVDRREILAILREEAGCRRQLPAAANRAACNAMSTARIRSLGWMPGGRPLFEETVRRTRLRFPVQEGIGVGIGNGTARADRQAAGATALQLLVRPRRHGACSDSACLFFDGDRPVARA